MSPTSLAGASAIVTGASRGFGRAIAVALAQAGTQVIGVAQHQPELDKVSQQLGDAFVPVAANAADPDLPHQLIARYQPKVVVLNAGAAPHTAPLAEHTWQTFSANWNMDVQQVFHFIKESLCAPLEPGSVVVSFSSGAALRGSPLSGGYAGAKATIRFISAYADREAREQTLGIRFVSVLPQLTPATALGVGGVKAYAAAAGLSVDGFISQLGPTLTTEQVAQSVVSIATKDTDDVLAYLLTPDGPKDLD
jgi:NAD(P)-dependent dehydrogenase (short-subunit alcohol dehydrogenase family)